MYCGDGGIIDAFNSLYLCKRGAVETIETVFCAYPQETVPILEHAGYV
jgi:hypothetical protein